MTLSPAHQYAAGLAWRNANGDPQQAAALFTSTLRGAKLELPRDPKSYVAKWGPRLGDDGWMQGRASQSGRKRALTEAQIECCHAVASEWWEDGRPRPYASMDELAANPVVARELAAAGCTPATLFRGMKQMYPHFGWRLVAVKDYLTADHKQERVAACKEMAKLTSRELDLVVWIDAKSLILVVRPQHAWIDTDYRDYEQRARPPQQGSKIINLKYYIAVSPLLGPFWLRFTTGTTGMQWDRDGHAYKVGSRAKQSRRPAATHVRGGLLQLGSPARAQGRLGHARICMQPQN